MTSSRPDTPSGERARTPYTRFIPREELEGAAVWMPGALGTAFDGGGPAAGPTLPWQALDGADEALPAMHSASAKVAGLAAELRPGRAAASPGNLAARAQAQMKARMPSELPADLSVDMQAQLLAQARAQGQPTARGAAGRSPAAPDLTLDEPAGAAVDTANHAANHAADHTALASAEQARADAEARAAELQSRLEAEVNAARQAGYQDGYRDGLVALDSFKTSYAQQVTAQVGQVLQSLDGELRQLEQSAAASLARVAIALARQVVRSELATHPDKVVQVATEAVNAVMTGARQITVKLHPDDHALVAQGCADLLEARGARLVAEPSVDRGGCLVDTEAGGVDARIATRWAAAMQTMGSAAPWQTDDAPGAET